ncbi:MAG: hypothetical protein DRN12_00785 [Thermoplasmata archaeon]|nr:MAG: hypothetical protein DRN12_00785 [Thermoplasmata archaeon]HEC89981.1 transcriptional repressor [Thermoplasmatales archaeon]
MFEKYVRILKEHSMKVTPQRLEILRYLDEHRNHPTVEMIYLELKKRSPSLSKTTIYNSVEILEKHGIIQSLRIIGNETRYDYRSDLHHHFICKKCGRIFDIDLTCPVIDRVEKNGFKVEEIHGYFKGICKDCLEKEIEENGPKGTS